MTSIHRGGTVYLASNYFTLLCSACAQRAMIVLQPPWTSMTTFRLLPLFTTRPVSRPPLCVLLLLSHILPSMLCRDMRPFHLSMPRHGRLPSESFKAIPVAQYGTGTGTTNDT